MNTELTIEQMKRWGIKGSLGILDQALYSGANFVLSILLARWVSAEMYGIFAATFSIFLLLSTFQVAFIGEPMSVYGVDNYKDTVVSYLNYLLRIQWLGSVGLTVLVCIFTLFLKETMIRETLLAMAFTMPLILFYWYLRRAFYLEAQSGLATFTSLVYCLSQILLIVLLRASDLLNPLTAYTTMALSSLAASVFTLKKLGMDFFGHIANGRSLQYGAVPGELWEFGRWLLLAYVSSWVTTLSFPILITFFMDHEFAGVLRAVQNLFLPFQQFLAAITLLFLPWLAKKRMEEGLARLFVLTRRIAWSVGMVAILYCLVIVAFRNEIMKFLYANQLYTSFSGLVPYVAIATLVSAMHLVLGLGLRVLRQTDSILWSKGAAVVFLLLVGLPAIGYFQMNGVLFALVSSALLEAAILFFYYFRLERTLEPVHHRIDI